MKLECYQKCTIVKRVVTCQRYKKLNEVYRRVLNSCTTLVVAYIAMKFWFHLCLASHIYLINKGIYLILNLLLFLIHA
jgi:hypothetical protein